LNLRQTRITDAAIPHLVQCSKLESLVLSETDLTDRSIIQLRELNLNQLVVPVPQISKTTSDKFPKPTIVVRVGNSFSDLMPTFRASIQELKLGDLEYRGENLLVVRFKFNDGESYRILEWAGNPRERFTNIYLIGNEPVTELRIHQRLGLEDRMLQSLFDFITRELKRRRAVNIAEPEQRDEVIERLGEQLGRRVIKLWEIWVRCGLRTNDDAARVYRENRVEFDQLYRKSDLRNRFNGVRL
jgi:hypothetical protein